jgi:glycosyltransferase involved in cell wall biosynthesis
MTLDTLIVVAARDEADRIAATLAALARAFPGAPIWVADDGSTDATTELARAAGATVVRGPRGAPRRDEGGGKGQAMTAGVRAALGGIDSVGGDTRVRESARDSGYSESSDAASESARPVGGAEPIVVLCDGDLGRSASLLAALVDAVRREDADLAVGAFVARAGGGFGLARDFARRAIRRRCGLSTRAPISGQRAVRASVLADVMPFASGFGMEIAMTIDAVRAGHRVVEIDLDLAHRTTGRTPAGFVHRARQLVDFVRVYRARR